MHLRLHLFPATTHINPSAAAAPEYAVFVSGNDPEAAKYVGLLAVSLNSIKQYYDEKYDRSNFIKNVILDNILPGDIYLKSRELRFNSDVSRVCMLIKVTNQTDVSAYDVVQNLFRIRTRISSSTSMRRTSRS